VKADPNFPPAWHNLADLLDESGRLTEAVDCERRALTADPNTPTPCSTAAWKPRRSGDVVDAVP
jgi:tetratricopeptide (TPR) repeat protein